MIATTSAAAASSECTGGVPSPASFPSSPVSLVLSVREYLLLTLASAPLVESSVASINALLRWANVPEESLISNEEFVLSWTAVVVTLVGYYFLFGKMQGRQRRRLAEELRVAQMQVHVLEEKLLEARREEMMTSASPASSRPRKSKEIRIFFDGAFDVMHYGHMNAFRLAKSLGTHLIVGMNTSESITECKGPPLMDDEERLAMVEGCKFVDQVVLGCPYILTAEYLDHIFETYDVDYVVHGDDLVVVDGKDIYASAKRTGRFRTIPRTVGVSTTDIVGRMLMMTKEHHLHTKSKRAQGSDVGSLAVSRSRDAEDARVRGGEGSEDGRDVDSDVDARDSEEEDVASVLTAASYKDDNSSTKEIGVLGNQSKFLTTSMMIRLFSAGMSHPEPGMRVVYVDGAWDMFHPGHVKFLKEASKRGDYLIVGIHGDSVVNRRRGCNLPLMNLHERVLSVLGCKYMNDVLIDAPLEVTPDMIASLGITEVVHGTESDVNGPGVDRDDRYRYPKQMGIFTTLESPSEFKFGNILSRIQSKHSEFRSKIDRKKRAEREWFDGKYQNGGERNGTSKAV